jgi:hypothetical protein
MRKFIVTLTLLLALATTLPTNAQGVNFGIKGGMNNTEMSFDKDVFKSSNRYGWFIGPALKISLPIIGIDFAAMYDKKETKVNGKGIEQQSFVVPVNLRAQIGMGRLAGIYLAAGPQFEFNIGKTDFNWLDANDYRNTFKLAESNFSLNLGAGIYLFKHLEAGFTYNLAIGKTGETTFESALQTITENYTRNKTWTITAAYYF